MSDCGCSHTPVESHAQQQVLRIALVLNATMFVVEVGAGVAAHSSGLTADGLDMLADASAYAIAIAALERSDLFKAKAAMFSGLLLLLLGLGVLADVLRRLIVSETPHAPWMIGVAAVALAVNATVLHLLNKQAQAEIHIRASRIFTRADVIANMAVIASGIALLLTGSRYFDLMVGAGIGIYVVREAFEILSDARQASAKTRQNSSAST